MGNCCYRPAASVAAIPQLTKPVIVTRTIPTRTAEDVAQFDLCVPLYVHPGSQYLSRLRQLAREREALFGGRDCSGLVLDYVVGVIYVGMMLDVCGTTETLNMFVPAPRRWDLCRVVSILDDKQIIVSAVDRVHPYPYLYPDQRMFSPRTAVALASGDLAPPLSMVRRPEPRNVVDMDLIDFYDHDRERWEVAEVQANIGSALWLLLVDRYKSAEDKDSHRIWLHADIHRTRRYRGAPDCLPTAEQAARITDACGYNFKTDTNPRMEHPWKHLFDH